ncbi:YihY/virulence factor BrkB family protein [Bacillus sp. FJAT-27251]|uniref:YihY/virulence factor BrkB family protein n=1 Tax=Bacillus sp. FJAT-27251 TaxID=1684142 RepID=UPI0006A7EED4|nr:YihY/virulence factor BrkB family protein [Bacillus sp. FJAT-27251]
MKDKLLRYGKKVFREFQNDQATGLAAQQAYYYMLALFPMLILLVAIVPYLNIQPESALQFVDDALPPEAAELLRDNVLRIVTERNGGLLTFGIIGTIWSASNGMNAFIKAMNTAFDVEETRSFIKARLISILMTFALILAFVVALLLPVFGRVILDFLTSLLPISGGMEILLAIMRWVIAFTIIIAVLVLLYRVAPNKKYPWKHVLPGAIFATIMWQLISLGFSFYVSNFGNYSATYGSIGGVIVLMLWLFLTGLALVIGGEINAVYHHEKDRERKFGGNKHVITP